MLFGGGLIERRGLRTELDVDGFALDLVGPFEVRAMTLGGVGIIDFTGPKVDTPWWNDTRAIMIEGSSGVFVYGEVKEREGLKIGDNIECGDVIGEVVTVLKKDKGKPMTMLHVELYEHKFRDRDMVWELGKEKPEPLLDPTKILLEIKKKT